MRRFEKLGTSNLENFIVFLDVDGTLVPHNGTTCSEKIIEKIEELKKKNRVYICSNNRNNKRNQKISNDLNLPIINQRHKKPNKKILDFLKEKEKDGPFLVIGDKYYPDKLFAKRINADFLKVKRVTSKKEIFIIRFIYWLDDSFSRFLVR